MFNSHLLYLLYLLVLIYKVVGQHSIIAVAMFKNNAAQQTLGPYCLRYNPLFHLLPTDESNAAKYTLFDATPSTYCNGSVPAPPSDGFAVAVMRGNCNFVTKAWNVLNVGGVAAFIVSQQPLTEPGVNSTGLNGTAVQDLYDHTNITVALIGSADFDNIRAWNSSGIEVYVWSPNPPVFDYNMIIIFMLAVGTVALGAWWSGVPSTVKGNVSANANPGNDDGSSLRMTVIFIVVFVVLMCGLLVLLYFFYDYLVYVVIALFTLASTIALFNCLEFLVLKITCCRNTRIPENNLPLLKSQPPVVLFFIAALAIAITIFWAVERKESWAWILQDILGFCFCLYMLRTIVLPKLMICAILLILLFFYDIFFVFITPLFTKTGQSVMVDVATGQGGKSGEQLPMVFKVPHITSSVLYACSTSSYSMLGFGDILVPGLLVGFLHNFDIHAKTGHVYYVASVCAYGVGLVICFVALSLMQTGQPALLYLVPCTLLTTVAIGLKRGELKQLWNGIPDNEKADSNTSNNNSGVVDGRQRSREPAVVGAKRATGSRQADATGESGDVDVEQGEVCLQQPSLLNDSITSSDAEDHALLAAHR